MKLKKGKIKDYIKLGGHRNVDIKQELNIYSINDKVNEYVTKL